MLASGAHDNKDEPPAASMFTRGTKQQRQSESSDDVIMSVINSLCQAITSKQGPVSTRLSGMMGSKAPAIKIERLTDSVDHFCYSSK